MFNHEQGIGAVHTRHIHLTENLADQGPLDDQHVNQSEYKARFNKRVLFHFTMEVNSIKIRWSDVR